MTLIAAFTNNHFGTAMVGDLLLSNDTKQQLGSLYLPARFNSKRPEEAGHIVGMCQKLHIISPTFAIAWANNQVIARYLINEMHQSLPNPASTDEVFDLIDNSDLLPDELKNVSLVFGLLQDDGNGEQIQKVAAHNFKVMDVQDRFRIRYAGTGSYHFFDSASYTVKATYEATKHNGYWLYFSELAARAAMAFYSEVMNWANYNFSYGGSFEFLIANASGWSKPSYLIAYWLIQDGKIKPINPVTLHSYGPDGELFIDQYLPGGIQTEHRSFRVPHLLKTPMHTGEPSLFAPGMADFSIHFIIDAAFPTKQPINFHVFYGNEQPLVLQHNGDEVRIDVHAELIEQRL